MTKRVNYSSGGYSAAGGSTSDKGALFHTAVRVGVSAAMLQGYTTAYLGRPVSQASVTNAVVMGAAVAVSERIATMIYHPSETQHKYKTGVSSWAASALVPGMTAGVFALAYPRIFSTNASMTSLATTAFAVDFASNMVTPFVYRAVA